MIRRTSTILLVSLLLVAFLAMTAFAAKANQKGQYGRALLGKQDASKILAYSFADEMAKQAGTSTQNVLQPLGTVAASNSASPGLTVGWTWYDQQHNCSIGRMIETGPHTGNTATDRIVHMGWMLMPEALDTRTYGYAAYNSGNATLVGPILLSGPPAYAGYVNVDVTPDNRAIVGGHYQDGDGFYASHMFFDGGPAYANFPNAARLPDSTMAYGQTNAYEAIWPKFFFQFGTDTVLHVFAEISETADRSQQALMYFRYVGFEGSGSWDYPPYVVDTVQDIAQDIIGQRTGDRIVMVWFASMPYQETLCDTCSGISVYDGYLIGQMDNDIYYQESLDQGATFEPRVNMTQVEIGSASWKAFCDASALYDSEGNLHIIWHAIPWAADLCIEDGGFCWASDWRTNNARLMHWSENVPYIRPIADQVFDVDHEVWDSCMAGAWNIKISKPTISECDGNLYAIWVQFNDGKQGVIDDCAEWAWKKDDPIGSANGDVWLSVSEDWGMTWDYQRNLTNTYTPHCGPKADDCGSEHWPSMSRTGFPVLAGEDWTGAVIVDPSGGSYTGDYYLDVQYVEDRDAGIIVQAEGSWTDNPINWFRLPCVDPIPAPIFAAEWTYYGDPSYCKPGEYFDTTLMIENIGNTELTYTYAVIEDNGTPGWLLVTGYSGSLPSGLAGTEYGDLRLNANMMTDKGNYFGRITFSGNDPMNMPLDVEIELIITDTIMPPTYDVVKTNCLSLATSNFGNYGRSGMGTVNMDYYDAGDCDTLQGKTYLYDASPLIGRVFPGDDTTFNWAIWGTNYYSEYGLRPQGGERATKVCLDIDAQVYQGGTFSTQDSCIGFQQIMVAPQTDCNFIIEYLKVWSFDGDAHDGIMLGGAIDWDIPTDYKAEDTGQSMAATNSGAVDGPRGLVYMQGIEEYGAGADTLYPYNCTDNSMRFGGQAFVESYLNDAFRTNQPFSGFAGENDSLQTDDGFFHGKLYYEMAQSGLRGTDSIEDLHAVLTYEPGFNFGASDVYEAVVVLATIENGTLGDFQAAVDAGKAWYVANGGMDMFNDLIDMNGDPNPNGIIDVCEGCCIEMGKFYQDGGPFSILDIDNFTEWLLRNPGVPDDFDCLEEVDVSGATPGTPDGVVSILDLDYLIGYLLRGDYTTLGECP